MGYIPVQALVYVLLGPIYSIKQNRIEIRKGSDACGNDRSKRLMQASLVTPGTEHDFRIHRELTLPCLRASLAGVLHTGRGTSRSGRLWLRTELTSHQLSQHLSCWCCKVLPRLSCQDCRMPAVPDEPKLQTKLSACRLQRIGQDIEGQTCKHAAMCLSCHRRYIMNNLEAEV